VLQNTGTHSFYVCSSHWVPIIQLLTLWFPSPYPASTNHYTFPWSFLYCPHMREYMQYLFALFWLILLHITSSSPIHSVANDKLSSFICWVISYFAVVLRHLSSGWELLFPACHQCIESAMAEPIGPASPHHELTHWCSLQTSAACKSSAFYPRETCWIELTRRSWCF
jgi:hypothetical protein